MKKYVILLFILFGVWVLASIDWFVCYLKKECREKPKVVEVIKQKPAKKVAVLPKAITYNKLYFKANSSNPLYTNNSFMNYVNLQNFINAKSKNKKLIIGVNHYSNESNEVFNSRKSIVEKLVVPKLNGLQYEFQRIPLTATPNADMFEVTHYKTTDIIPDLIIEGNTIYFPYNSVNLKQSRSFAQYLDKFTPFILKSNKSIHIIGHTDSLGEKSSNYKLGLKRAKTIKNMFIKKGLASSRISISSKGELNPIATNKTKTGRQKNRRVEIIIKENK